MDYSNETLLDAFRRLQREEPNRVLFTFVDEDGRDADSLTASQLYQAAMSIADFLANDCNLEPGDRVLLVYPQSLDVVKSFRRRWPLPTRFNRRTISRRSRLSRRIAAPSRR
jgi:acyl-CoA synthetase (AMP-forming)/AMP-acid ligase II